MRFAVAASTVSGLLVALLTAAAGRVSRSWLSWDLPLPLLLGLGWALVALPLALRARRRVRRPRRVFLIVAAFTGKQWVAQLIRDLHENLERRSWMQSRLRARVPTLRELPTPDAMMRRSAQPDAVVFAGIPSAADTVVAGVDGTPDARALIAACPGPLRATVVQNSYKVAEAAVKLLEKMFRNEPVPRRTSVPVRILARD